MYYLINNNNKSYRPPQFLKNGPYSWYTKRKHRRLQQQQLFAQSRRFEQTTTTIATTTIGTIKEICTNKNINWYNNDSFYEYDVQGGPYQQQHQQYQNLNYYHQNQNCYHQHPSTDAHSFSFCSNISPRNNPNHNSTYHYQTQWELEIEFFNSTTVPSKSIKKQ